MAHTMAIGMYSVYCSRSMRVAVKSPKLDLGNSAEFFLR